jgi:hypothetical protein
MNFEQAREVVLNLLRQHGRARTSELLANVGGDEALIFNDLAKDKDGASPIYTGPAASPTARRKYGPRASGTLSCRKRPA